MSRRNAITVGSLSALGLSLGDLFRMQASAEDGKSEAFAATKGQSKQAKATSVIQIHLPGGMPHHETFDPKPEAPVEIRGSFGVTKSKSGEILSENLPMIAGVMDKVTIVRSMVGKIPDHSQATYQLYTGYTPTAAIDYPSIGSVVSHELGKRGILPPYIAVPNLPGFAGRTGFLSSAHGAFEVNADPGVVAQGQKFQAPDLSIPDNVPLDRFDRRKLARAIAQKRLRALDQDSAMQDTMDGFYQDAYKLLSSEKAQRAFGFEGEPESIFDLYGSQVTVKERGPSPKPAGLAERLIMARRLVEAGTRFVSVNYSSWDCHTNVKDTCSNQLPPFDHAVSGLITDLEQRGLLDSTLVWVTTEFGRTPKVNSNSGRDHWARCYSMMLAGGGISRGQVYGASDAIGGEPARDAVPLEDLQHTIYHLLGIDASKELVAFGTRPIEIIKGGKLVDGILA